MNEYISINFLKLFDKEKSIRSIHKILYIENNNHLVTLNELNNKIDEINGVSLTNYFARHNELFILKKNNNKKIHYLIVKIDNENQDKAILLKEFIYEKASPNYFNKYKDDIIPFLLLLNILEVRKQEKELNSYLMRLNENNLYHQIFSSILYSIKKTNQRLKISKVYSCKELFDIMEKEISKTVLYNKIKNELKIDSNEFINNKTSIHIKRNKYKNIQDIINFKEEYFDKTLKHSLEINFLSIIYKYYCYKNDMPLNIGIVKLIKLTIEDVIHLMEELQDNFYYN